MENLRKERRKRINATDEEINAAYELAESLGGVEVALLFSEWIEYKRQRSERYTPIGARMVAKRMAEWSNLGFDLRYAVELAISKDWQGWEFDSSKRARTQVRN